MILDAGPTSVAKIATAFEVLPGVLSLLAELSARDDVILGLGTGNTEGAAYAKLARGELDSFFSFGGFGSDHSDRAELLRAGLERTSGPNYGAWIASRNWVADALRRPMVARPGGRMLYSTGSTHVLGAALSEATGKSLLSQARDRLGDPLGIEIPAWTRDPQGYYLGGNEMALRPIAMLKIATLMRDGGRYEGRQVIPEHWIDVSMQPRARSPWSGMSYGYGWFLTSSGFVLGRGYGGQVIAANPSRGLAVAITSDPKKPARSAGYFGDLMRLLEGPVMQFA